MVVSEITLYNLLKSKYGEQDAEIVVEGIKQTIKDGFESKRDQFVSKEDLANAKSDILRWTFAFVFGALLLNIIAIIGAVISVAHIVSK
jgi:hypothetical protein